MSTEPNESAKTVKNWLASQPDSAARTAFLVALERGALPPYGAPSEHRAELRSLVGQWFAEAEPDARDQLEAALSLWVSRDEPHEPPAAKPNGKGKPNGKHEPPPDPPPVADLRSLPTDGYAPAEEISGPLGEIVGLVSRVQGTDARAILPLALAQSTLLLSGHVDVTLDPRRSSMPITQHIAIGIGTGGGKSQAWEMLLAPVFESIEAERSNAVRTFDTITKPSLKRAQERQRQLCEDPPTEDVDELAQQLAEVSTEILALEDSAPERPFASNVNGSNLELQIGTNEQSASGMGRVLWYGLEGQPLRAMGSQFYGNSSVLQVGFDGMSLSIERGRGQTKASADTRRALLDLLAMWQSAPLERYLIAGAKPSKDGMSKTEDGSFGRLSVVFAGPGRPTTEEPTDNLQTVGRAVGRHLAAHAYDKPSEHLVIRSSLLEELYGWERDFRSGRTPSRILGVEHEAKPLPWEEANGRELRDRANGFALRLAEHIARSFARRVLSRLVLRQACGLGLHSGPPERWADDWTSEGADESSGSFSALLGVRLGEEIDPWEREPSLAELASSARGEAQAWGAFGGAEVGPKWGHQGQKVGPVGPIGGAEVGPIPKMGPIGSSVSAPPQTIGSNGEKANGADGADGAAFRIHIKEGKFCSIYKDTALLSKAWWYNPVLADKCNANGRTTPDAPNTPQEGGPTGPIGPTGPTCGADPQAALDALDPRAARLWVRLGASKLAQEPFTARQARTLARESGGARRKPSTAETEGLLGQLCTFGVVEEEPDAKPRRWELRSSAPPAVAEHLAASVDARRAQDEQPDGSEITSNSYVEAFSAYLDRYVWPRFGELLAAGHRSSLRIERNRTRAADAAWAREARAKRVLDDSRRMAETAVRFPKRRPRGEDGGGRGGPGSDASGSWGDHPDTGPRALPGAAESSSGSPQARRVAAAVEGALSAQSGKARPGRREWGSGKRRGPKTKTKREPFDPDQVTGPGFFDNEPKEPNK